MASGLWTCDSISVWCYKLLLLSCFSRVRLCDPIDGSSPGSPVPGILQARTLEWVAISFSNAWKWKVKVNEKWKWSRSVMSDCSRPHGLQPTKLLRLWDFPGKSTGVSCHCLLHLLPYCFLNYIIVFLSFYIFTSWVFLYLPLPFCLSNRFCMLILLMTEFVFFPIFASSVN